MNNTGIHHISSLVGNIYQAYDFYHRILGMDLILKTVNQEDSNMYHLFFGDQKGRIGTEFTIFDMPNSPTRRPGSNALERTVFLVPDQASLIYWMKRLDSFGVEHSGIQVFGKREILFIQDGDGQELGFTYHEVAIERMFPSKESEVPQEHAILGIAGLQMRIREVESLRKQLVELYGFKVEESFVYQGQQVLTVGFDNDFHHRLDLILDLEAPISVMGVGSIHHIAFGVENHSDLEDLVTRLNLMERPHTGIINRDFMHSLYYRAPNYLMFEVATASGHREAPIPQQKELLDQIPLFLPTFLEEDRADIESSLAERYE